MTKRQAKYLFFAFLRTITRKVFSCLPKWVNICVGKLGYTEIIKHSSGVNFIAPLYNSNYKINVRSDYGVERAATSKNLNPLDPFYGISQLGLTRFQALDIGANVGTISLGLASIGASHVHAFEPGPLCQRLLHNVALNAAENIIKVHQIGLGSKESKLFWAEDKNNPGNAHLVESIDHIDFSKISTKFSNSEFKEVCVTTLDKFADDYISTKVDLIKIDVEGMEWEVLQGGEKLIKRDLPIVVAETHRVASDMMKYDCMTPMFYFFYNLGYESFSLNDEGILEGFIYPNFGSDTFFIPKGFFKKSL